MEVRQTMLRFITPDCFRAVLAETELIGRTVHLSPTCRCKTAIIRGLPAKRFSILVDERLLGEDLDAVTTGTKALVIGVKTEDRVGCFDGSVRPQLIIRGYPVGVPGTPTEEAVVSVYADDVDERLVHVDIDGIGGEPITMRWTGQRMHTGEVAAPDAILYWHWTRSWWSVPLPISDREVGDEVRALAAFTDAWAPPSTGEAPPTIAAWNRAAERALYRLARARGWRKLTQRERDRLRIRGGAWVHETVYAAAQARLHERRGFGPVWPHARPAPYDRRPDVSEHTLEAASGHHDVTVARGGFGYEDETEA